MGVTISTHNGSAVRREHNIRNPKVVSKEPHIDTQGSHEVWIDEPVRKAYYRLFGAATEAYNAKQTRSERQISSYYNAVCKDAKKHPAYEMIIGIYGKQEDGLPICSPELGKEIMSKFVDTWEKRNPNLELIGVYYHADEEGEPHVHLDYIPVAHGYTRGLETQTGLVKALGEQGYKKKGKETAQIQWEKSENDYLTSLCEAAGLQVDHPREKQEHLRTDEYKLRKRIEQLEASLERQQREYAELVTKANNAESRAQEAEQRAKGADARAEAAEYKLQEVNGQYDEAAKGLKDVLDKKARASEIHRIFRDKETQIYHKNMLENTRAIGSEAYEELKEANKTMQEAVAVRQRAERKEESIEPLYRQANEAYRVAEQERKKQQKITADMEKQVEQRAKQLADAQVRAMFNGISSKREQRLEDYCDRLTFPDGRTALEAFEEQENALKKRSRGMER